MTYYINVRKLLNFTKKTDDWNKGWFLGYEWEYRGIEVNKVDECYYAIFRIQGTNTHFMLEFIDDRFLNEMAEHAILEIIKR